jgi:hypothetical protein
MTHHLRILSVNWLPERSIQIPSGKCRLTISDPIFFVVFAFSCNTFAPLAREARCFSWLNRLRAHTDAVMATVGRGAERVATY